MSTTASIEPDIALLASRDHALSPWYMGLPFAIGQLLVALIVHRTSEIPDAH